MAKTLVIVESPSKAKTINKYLGREYTVKSSVGHIRDLPKSTGAKVPPPRQGGKVVKKSAAEKAAQARRALIRRMGVDPENDWAADYQVLPDKTKVLKELREAASKAEKVLLATDLDREGEAIAWHLREAIGGDHDRFHRVTFAEITKKAILKAFETPGDINMDRVNAQQARRFLDRVVGFQVSPLLWKKVARGLSAGRVQSVATRLVVEREREIHAFIPEEYWQIHALLNNDGGQAFRAEVVKRGGEAVAWHDHDAAHATVATLEQASYQVREVQRKPVKQRPYPPFITSTLQQAASVRLGFAVKKTMTLAQRLYEAGLITYMRTDSLNLSPDAVAACRDFIQKTYGPDYVPEAPQVYKSKAGAQEAHEAIRPTDVEAASGELAKLDADQRRLYDLIHRQFVACQMPPAVFDTTTVVIDAADYELRARGRVLRFAGWTKVLPPAKRDDQGEELPPLVDGEALALKEIQPSQHFTKPPARYNEASLVKEMERLGIGRPSTYAAIIATIQDRGYVRLEGKRLYAEKTGEVVTSRLQENFSDLLDYGFTAGLEEELDHVAAGDADWKAVLNRFYAEFSKTLEAAEESMRPNNPTPTDIACNVCGRHMMVRTGQTGVFLGCSGYDLPPKERCTATMNLSPGEEAVDADTHDEDASAAGEALALRAKRRCPLCSTAMDSYLVDEHRKLHVCGNNPDCPGFEVEEGHFKIKGYDGPLLDCDKCGSPMHLKNGRFGKYFGCTNDACKNTRKLLRNGQPAPPKADPVPMPELSCEKSDGHFVLRDGAAGLFLASSNYPRSRETRNPLVKELAAHRSELDPKHQYLADGPQADPEGNPAVIRWSRNEKAQYLMSEVDGKATGWTAHYIDGQWQIKTAQTGDSKAAGKKKAGAGKAQSS